MKICVIGVGNIGMRYVQGITKIFPDVQLFLVDCFNRLREFAETRMEIDENRLPKQLAVASQNATVNQTGGSPAV